MEPVLCINCYGLFLPSPRHKNQSYCMKPECRRAKKAAWKRTKMRADANFRQDQRLSNKKWAQTHRDYWTRYRKRNPDKANRNRILQRIRNKRRAANRSKCAEHNEALIAKVDALKVNIVEVTAPYR